MAFFALWSVFLIRGCDESCFGAQTITVVGIVGVDQVTSTVTSSSAALSIRTLHVLHFFIPLDERRNNIISTQHHKRSRECVCVWGVQYRGSMSFFLTTRSTRNKEEQDALATESIPNATTPLSPKQQLPSHVVIDGRETTMMNRHHTADHENDDIHNHDINNDGVIKTDDHNSNNSAATPISPSLSSIPSIRLFQDRPLWQRVLLTINVILCVPMYSMLLCLGIYIWILQIYWNVIWFRTLWLLYLPYCVLDPTPTITTTTSSSLSSLSKRRWCSWPCWSWPEAWRSRLRNAPCFTWVGYYFPVTLIKTCELDPHQHYLFLYHPHGVIGMGANTALNTNGANFEQVFPGVRI